MGGNRKEQAKRRNAKSSVQKIGRVGKTMNKKPPTAKPNPLDAIQVTQETFPDDDLVKDQ